VSPLIDPVMHATTMPADQRTIYILDTLAASPQVSGEMREWARIVLDLLFDSSGAASTF
jgi:hypothetical protein